MVKLLQDNPETAGMPWLQGFAVETIRENTKQATIDFVEGFAE